MEDNRQKIIPTSGGKKEWIKVSPETRGHRSKKWTTDLTVGENTVQGSQAEKGPWGEEKEVGGKKGVTKILWGKKVGGSNTYCKRVVTDDSEV